eukprot:8136647-Heterocapsa_arctica.AAC.1
MHAADCGGRASGECLGFGGASRGGEPRLQAGRHSSSRPGNRRRPMRPRPRRRERQRTTSGGLRMPGSTSGWS